MTTLNKCTFHEINVTALLTGSVIPVYFYTFIGCCSKSQVQCTATGTHSIHRFGHNMSSAIRTLKAALICFNVTGMCENVWKLFSTDLAIPLQMFAN